MRDEEIIKHRQSGDESPEEKEESVFVVAFEKIFIRKDECREEEDEDDWCDPERNVGMEAKSENSAGDEEITESSGAQTLEEEIE